MCGFDTSIFGVQDTAQEPTASSNDADASQPPAPSRMAQDTVTPSAVSRDGGVGVGGADGPTQAPDASTQK